jgi:threonine dehydrogenase-like Zn-dependent dehydrogenase
MKALRFHYSLPRLAATRVLGWFAPRVYLSILAPIRYETVPDPELPGDDWVRVRTRLAGICGSDVKQVLLRGALDNPLAALISLPHVLGHEAVGVIEAVGPGVRERRVGERVVLNPWLSCIPRGIDPPCSACRDGDLSLCRNFDRGVLPRSLHLGNNACLPGAFAPTFVCHESQCFPVPDALADEVAVLADPFSVSLHSVLRSPPPSDAPALVYGLGTLGLVAVAFLHTLYPEVKVYAIGRHPHQIALARTLGASEVLVGRPEELILQAAKLTGARPLRPWRGLPWLLDGVGVVYDTVGSPETVETALRLVRSRGRLVMSGVEAPARFEWTPLYFKEVEVVGSNAFGVEPFRGERRHAIDIYLQLASEGLDLSELITHHFPLAGWREAFLACMHKRVSGAIKVVFDFPNADG